MKRFSRQAALEVAALLRAHTAHCDEAIEFAIAGSVRRLKPEIGDLDLVVVTDAPAIVAAHLLAFPQISQVLCSGASKVSVILQCGLQVDIRFCVKEAFGSMLAHCTGPMEHNIAMRQLAKMLGFKLNEYGLFSGESRIAGLDEKSIYEALRCDWIEPSDRGAFTRRHTIAPPQPL